MKKRRLLNLPKNRQQELAYQFPWLKALIEDERPESIQALSVSVFDHWLSQDEACALLEGVSIAEQKRRDELLAGFCKSVVDGTSVLSVTFRGRKDDRLLFRKFISEDALVRYCTPGGGKTLKHRHFLVALPDLDCVFMGGWDDTMHFFFEKSTAIEVVNEWAYKSGVHVLKHA